MGLQLEAMNARGFNGGFGMGEEDFNFGMHFHSIKLDFLIFDGRNSTCWAYKAIHYFALHPMPNGQKILLFSIYMEGNALIWFEDSEKTKEFSTWKYFVVDF